VKVLEPHLRVMVYDGDSEELLQAFHEDILLLKLIQLGLGRRVGKIELGQILLGLVQIILFIESDKLGSESHKNRVTSDFWYPLKQAQIKLIK